MFDSRSPASRTASSRLFFTNWLLYQTLTATMICEAGISWQKVFLVVLKAQMVCLGKRLSRTPMKNLKAQMVMTGKIRKSITKNLLAQMVMVGRLTRQASLKRTLTATMVMTGSLKRTVTKNLKATMVMVASRLKLERIWGWQFTGIFGAGQRIKVDADRQEVTLDGSNVIDLVDGEIPFFEPGANELNYSDGGVDTPVTGENVGTGDGVETTFTLTHAPILNETIYLAGAPTVDYTLNRLTGVTVFDTAPGAGVAITADYSTGARNINLQVIYKGRWL